VLMPLALIGDACPRAPLQSPQANCLAKTVPQNTLLARVHAGCCLVDQPQAHLLLSTFGQARMRAHSCLPSSAGCSAGCC
jgi:hypothetical protein